MAQQQHRPHDRHRLRGPLAMLLLLMPLMLPLAQAFTHDATIVTDLRVVRGATDAAAREACAALCPCRDSLTEYVTTNWFVAGDNLNTASQDELVYLCMRQDRRSALERDGATMFALQSVAVVESAACPSSMRLLFQPRSGVVVCMQSVMKAHALATGTYISSVDAVASTTTSRNDSGSGWTSVPTSVHAAASSSTSVYIRYKRPVRPIVSVQLVANLQASTSAATACRERFNVSWEPAGTGYIVDPSDSAKRSVLCVQRVHVPDDAAIEGIVAPRVLTQVEFVASSSGCGNGFQEQADMTPDWRACFKYEDGAASPFLSQLLLTTRAAGDTSSWPQDLSLDSTVDLNSSRSGLSTFMLVQEGDSSGGSVGLELTSTNTTATAIPLSARTPLQARLTDADSSGKQKLSFKILQIADLHLRGDPDQYCFNPPLERSACGMQCTENLTIAFLNDLLDAEKPDLVVFSGDTITVREWGRKDAALNAALAPVEERSIPYAWIMGNHDDDFVFDRQEIMDKLVSRELAYVESGPTAIQGVGNYELNIKPPSNGSWGTTNDTVFRIYLLDSNKLRNETLFPQVRSTYDWIRQEQIEFYRELSEAHAREDNGTVPAIMLFHIPIPEYSSFASVFSRHGAKHEKTEGPGYNSHLLAALEERQEVKATFVGHDHTNEYCYKTHGVQLCYGGGTGFGAATGKGSVARRARVIEWTLDADNRRQITSWKRHFGRAFGARQLEEVLYSEAR